MTEPNGLAAHTPLTCSCRPNPKLRRFTGKDHACDWRRARHGSPWGWPGAKNLLFDRKDSSPRPHLVLYRFRPDDCKGSSIRLGLDLTSTCKTGVQFVGLYVWEKGERASICITPHQKTTREGATELFRSARARNSLLEELSGAESKKVRTSTEALLSNPIAPKRSPGIFRARIRRRSSLVPSSIVESGSASVTASTR
jgi:hypothetical protein